MRVYDFLITDKNGNTRTESVAASDGKVETAYSAAVSLFKNCEVRLRRDLEYRWWYLLVGFAAGSIISALILFVIMYNRY